MLKHVTLLALLLGGLAQADIIYSEDFTGTNGAAWPSPWSSEFHVITADIQANRARLQGETVNVGRKLLPGVTASDVEVLLTVEYEDISVQGIGFYVRQNGGYLTETTPRGQGYAMFLEGFIGGVPSMGLWRETNGVEERLAFANNPVAGGILPGTRYRIRYRVTQADASSTLLQVKVWPEASAEPGAWTLEHTDSTPVLQGISGNSVADIYNQAGTGSIFIDDVSIESLNPVLTIPPGAPVSSPFLFVVVGLAVLACGTYILRRSASQSIG